MSSVQAQPPHPEGGIIFDWNDIPSVHRPTQTFDLHDETLRDGLQGASVIDPTIDHKLELIELMNKLGVRSADLGLPGAGQRSFDDVVKLTQFIQSQKFNIAPACAARTVLADIRWCVEAAQKAGAKMTVYAFIGSSPIRQWAEGWDLNFIEKSSAEAIAFAVKEGLDVAYVTEDTTRSSPQNLDVLFRSAIDCGAKRLVLCDTVGHATPAGVKALLEWTKGLIAGLKIDVKLEWHGHNDRGLAVVNALAAVEAGAHRLHACGLGVGERVGNTSMDQLLLNLKLLNWVDRDLHALVRYVETVAKATHMTIPVNYPLTGADAFRTATGVHAAAIIKAKTKGDDWLADRVYSGVPAGEFGRQQIIEVGHMSGMSNVKYWLAQRALPATDEVCQKILQRAKQSTGTLSEKEIMSLVRPVKRAQLKKAPKKTKRRATAKKGRR